ncbi:hypothetical protein DH2020_017381 [Rehmannia glutinosa]|uniref:DUF4408 domain-containing protein n=1 Tax=Rehmannia glutinosa TaxID=99300 RepID=A0ABR0WRB9_REHGL
MVSMSSWVLSMKVLLISAGVVSLAMGLRFSVPIAVNGIPAMWSVIMSWLKPPYLYIIINGIIITIAASSRFHQSQSEPPTVRSEHLISVKTPPTSSFESISSPPDVRTFVADPMAAEEIVVSEFEDTVVELKPVTVNGSEVDVETEEEIAAVEDEAGDVFVDSTFKFNNTLPQEIISPDHQLQLESLFPVREKPLVTSRFAHRKPNRTNPEGVRALRVARAKRQETLESTWKMITEGRHVPLTRHLKKSDTWEHHAPPAAVDHVPKSETFKDRSNYVAAPAPGRIVKEASLSQEELNRRVEAFIKKFNEDMRIQRQESLNQYMEMINRGV